MGDREITTRAREEIMNNNTAMVDSQQLHLHHDREIATRAREEIMNNNTAMVDSQQLQLHQQQQLHELQKTAINAQGLDCDDLQHFTTKLQITNTINDFSFYL